MPESNGLQDLDWSAMSRAEHKATFAALRACHAEAMAHVRIRDGNDNTAIFDLATAINRAMHAGNDDLTARESSLKAGDLSVLR